MRRAAAPFSARSMTEAFSHRPLDKSQSPKEKGRFGLQRMVKQSAACGKLAGMLDSSRRTFTRRLRGYR
jgi:hypothetical protein